LDLRLDKIALVIGLFNVLGVVRFQGLDAVAGLTGDEARTRSDRVEKAHVAMPRIVKRPRPDLLGLKDRQPFALLKIALVDRRTVRCGEEVIIRFPLKGEGFS